MSHYATARPVPQDQPDTAFRCRILDDDGSALDLTFATLLEITFQLPDGTQATETATVSTKAGQTDPADGWIEFLDGDPGTKTTQRGEWRYWGRATIGTDGPYESTSLRYHVRPAGED